MKPRNRKSVIILMAAVSVVGILLNKFYFFPMYNVSSSLRPVISTAVHVHELKQEVFTKSESIVDLSVNFNRTETSVNRTFKHLVLLYNKPPWINTEHYLLPTCEYNNCKFIVDKSTIVNSSAVVFYPSFPNMGSTPPARPTGQIWIFYSLEPPMNFYFPDYKSPAWRNTMNWSMTYRLDSDVVAPYGTILPRKTPAVRDYDKIWLRKKKFAVMVSSHCNPVSRRDEYVAQLRQRGVDIDVLGNCGTRVNFTTDTSEFVRMLNEYKFVFAFENSICPDYITEKVFQRYNYDVIIVGRGGGNYSKLLHGIPIISTANFANMTQLAKHLLDIGDNKDRYIGLLKRKDKYESFNEETFGYPYAMCELCRKLNFKQENRHIIKDMLNFLDRSTCPAPSDLEM